jgi:hypothetical protein
MLNVVVEGGLGTIADYPRFAQHLRSLDELRTATAPYYVDAEFRDREGLRDAGDDADVVVAVHVNPRQAKTAIVVANLAERRSQARLRLELILASAPRRVFPANRALDLDGDLVSLDLVPHEVVVIAVDGSAQR